MRWRIDLSYLGTHYCGWQRQPGDKTVQQTLEEAFTMILREPIEIVGCGRTDTGVHARKYIAHTDVSMQYDIPKIIYQVNAVLPQDIAIHAIAESEPGFHARFDAIERHYRYYIHFSKDPFLGDRSFYFNLNNALDHSAIQKAAGMLMQYEEYFPFCKTGSDAEHFKCKLTESIWDFSDRQAIFSIKANRFLRGMVRLIVGACLNVGLEKLSLETLEECLQEQKSLPVNWSVPAVGLYLENVIYPGDK